MATDPGRQPLERVRVRTYEPPDQAAVARLYTTGLLAGHIAPNDTAADLERIGEAYLSDPTNHFWVADSDGAVVGMIAVAREEERVAEIRRLRVAPAWQATPLAARLLETALTHCQRHGYLKVVLETRFDREAALELFQRFGFEHHRTRTLHGQEQPEFYLDLYRHPRASPEADGQK